MGNKRDQLKQDISRQLSRKIEAAQNLLSGLRLAQDDVKEDCFKAKVCFQKSIEELTQGLNARKIEVANQIDSLCQTQINFLQESIQATFIALGSLQSTLANLDSFDNGQLVNLAMPDYPWTSEEIQVSLIDVDSDCTQLKEDISKWGSAKNKELSTVQKVSFPVEYSSPTGSNAILGNSENIKTAPQNQGMNIEINEWLSKGEPKFTTDYEDDFEMVLVNSEYPNQDYYEATLISNEASSDESNSEIDNQSEGQASSSVVVVQHESNEKNATNSNFDLSQWLKPKYTEVVPPSFSNETKNSCVVPEEVTEKFSSFSSSSSASNISQKSTSIPSKRQYLDFPCLRLDPKCWLKSKRVKDIEDLRFPLCSEVCFNLSQKEIIPPSYALPYPFWLKKC